MVPIPLVDVNIKLLGDSNYSGKIKFGTDRGTLDAALPGTSQFCAKIEDSPDLGELTDCTDVVLAVGTNNLKLNDSDPTSCAQAVYRKLKQYRRDLPNTRIILPGVISTSDSAVNERVKTLNKHLSDICSSRCNNMINYVDTRVFSDREGKLRAKLRCDNGGGINLHLNQEGITLLASRIKRVLRNNHNLPTGPVFRARMQYQGVQAQSASDRGSSCGGWRGRGRSVTSRGATNSEPGGDFSNCFRY